MHSFRRLCLLIGLLFCLALPGCGGRKEIRISGADPLLPAASFEAASGNRSRESGSDPLSQADDRTPDAEMSGADSGLREAPEDSSGEERKLTVYICGAVNRPGVVELREGARIYEAVDASGGLAPDADPERVNLAQPLTDGQMIVIVSKQEPERAELTGQSGIFGTYPCDAGQSGNPGTYPSEAGQSGIPGGRVNLNTASGEELMTLPGIGKSKADAIIRYREENGFFLSPEDVMNISGIKDAVYGKIKELITV